MCVLKCQSVDFETLHEVVKCFVGPVFPNKQPVFVYLYLALCIKSSAFLANITFLALENFMTKVSSNFFFSFSLYLSSCHFILSQICCFTENGSEWLFESMQNYEILT